MSDKKRILILTVEAGFGHLSAAKAISIALEEKYGEACVVEISNPFNDKRVPRLLRRTQYDYDRVVRDWPGIYKLGYKATDGNIRGTLLENSLVVLFYEAVRSIYKRFKPDAIVTTFPAYQAAIGAYFTLKNHYTPLLTVVTDLETIHWLWYNRAADYCLVPTDKAMELALEHGLSPETVKITGIPVHPKLAEPRDRTAVRQSLGWHTDRLTMLAVGSNRLGKLARYLQYLNHSGHPLQLAVVAGGNERLYKEIQTIDWHLPVYLYNFVENMPDLLHAADFVLCKPGGLMVTEALACGLPMILVDAIPGQETGNAEYVTTSRAGVYAKTPADVLETVSHWLADDGRQLYECAANARKLGKPDAAMQVADLAWEAAIHGPYIRSNRFPLGVNMVRELLGSFGILADERATGGLIHPDGE